jgi:hypothetical protein
MIYLQHCSIKANNLKQVSYIYHYSPRIITRLTFWIRSHPAGDFKYAEEYAMKAYEYAKQTLGEKSEIVGLVLFMLYDIYSSQHNLERAEWALLQYVADLTR